MTRIDLNQLRAARAEQIREPYTIIIGDPPKEYTVPHRLDWPVEVGEFLGVGEMRRAMQVLVGAQWEQMKENDLTMGDVQDLFEAIFDDDGLELGEASASNGSSPSTSGLSKATSNGSMVSTSARRSRPAKAASPPAASAT